MAAALPKLPKVSFHRRLPSEIQLPTSPLGKSEFNKAPTWSFRARARIAVLLTILVFIMGCHLIMHSMVNSQPRLDFGTSGEEEIALTSLANGPLDGFGGAGHNSAEAGPSTVGWFNLHAMWAPLPITDGKRAMRFVVTDGDPKETQN